MLLILRFVEVVYCVSSMCCGGSYVCVLWDVYLGPVFRNTFFYNQDFHKVIEMISKGLQG